MMPFGKHMGKPMGDVPGSYLDQPSPQSKHAQTRKHLFPAFTHKPVGTTKI